MPLEERKTSLGSGVIVRPDGLIVTNNHVIEQARQITITTADRRRHRGTLIGTDPVTDIAVLRISEPKLPSLAWGDSSRAQVGEYVVAIGNPFQLNQTVTMGIISATGRSNVGIVDYEDFIQTDAAINPGNSGGALVNTSAELIGINTAIYSETGGYQGIGFAVPSNLARNVLEQLVAHGRVQRGTIGITRISDVNEEMAAALGIEPPRGVVVLELLRRSPADRAGLEPGDVVLELDGRSVENAAQLRNELAAAAVGAVLRLGIWRNGRARELRVPVEEAPA
jgi:serine protease Do